MSAPKSILKNKQPGPSFPIPRAKSDHRPIKGSKLRQSVVVKRSREEESGEEEEDGGDISMGEDGEDEGDDGEIGTDEEIERSKFDVKKKKATQSESLYNSCRSGRIDQSQSFSPSIRLLSSCRSISSSTGTSSYHPHQV
jgi:hypothetical protein